MADDQYTRVPIDRNAQPAPAQGVTRVPVAQPAQGGASQSAMDTAAQPWHRFTSGAGFEPGNLVSNLYQGAKGAVKGVYNLGADLVNNPNWVEGKDSTLNKFVMEPAAREHQKAITAPTASESIGHSVAEAIPMIGPWAASLGEQAGQGDVGGALAQGAGAYGVMRPAESLRAVDRTAEAVLPEKVYEGGKAAVKDLAHSIPGVRAAVKVSDAVDARREAEQAAKDEQFVRGAERQSADMQRRAAAPVEAAKGGVDFSDRTAQSEPVPVQGSGFGGGRRVNGATLSPEEFSARAASKGMAPSDFMDALKKTQNPDVRPVNAGPQAEAVAPAEAQGAAADYMKQQGITETPKVEEVAGGNEMLKRVEKPATSEEVDAEARKAVDEMTKGKPKLSDTELRGMEHRLGAKHMDLLEDEGGIDLARQLLKGTNAEYLDTGRYLNVKGSGPDGEITGADLSRAGRSGKGLSPVKQKIIDAIRESDDPSSLIKHWGR